MALPILKATWTKDQDGSWRIKLQPYQSAGRKQAKPPPKGAILEVKVLSSNGSSAQHRVRVIRADNPWYSIAESLSANTTAQRR